MPIKKIKEKLKFIPKLPGVYIFKNKNNQVVYIGKAKNLFNRIHSYFNLNKDSKTSSLAKQIADLEYIATNNEVEALLLENNLIKKHLPKYNIKLKDSSSFPMIKITRENLPRTVKCREKVNNQDEYFGPFVKAKEVQALLTIFKKILQIRSCKKKFTPPYHYTPCLNYHIGFCCSPCSGNVTEEEYLERIQRAREVLTGNTKKLKNQLEKKMQFFAKQYKFENAAKMRDNIGLLNNFTQLQYISTISEDNGDYIGFFIHYNKTNKMDQAYFSIIQERDGYVQGKKNFNLKKTIAINEVEGFIYEFLKTYYLNTTNLPHKIYISIEVTELKTICEAIYQQSGIKTQIVLPSNKKSKQLIKMATENAELYFEENQYKLDKIHNLRELKKVLNLSHIPRIIECFDVATLTGKYNTAAMVHFKDGKSVKSEYRQFNITGEGHPDDYAMMEEVIGRRYQRLKNENKVLPDLIVVDGGKGQIRSAMNMMDLLDLKIPVIGLAKKMEHVFFPHQKKPLILDRNSHALKLLQNIRDEAHRFSNTRLSKRYKNDLLKSELTKIGNIGKSRINLLLKHFQSVEAMKKAKQQDIAKVEGIGNHLAEKIFHYFQQEKKE
ncbi:MAG: excinuclease ABC subunit UvrC [Spirochaetes bacterium]|nr:excinuclease ABC subunit UvrC [Spirochaetota bacterium]